MSGLTGLSVLSGRISVLEFKVRSSIYHKRARNFTFPIVARHGILIVHATIPVEDYLDFL